MYSLVAEKQSSQLNDTKFETAYILPIPINIGHLVAIWTLSLELKETPTPMFFQPSFMFNVTKWHKWNIWILFIGQTIMPVK